MPRILLFALVLSLVPPVWAQTSSAQTIHWKGHEWRVTSGHMAGVALGDPGNVEIDHDGNLHLQIVRRGDSWTSAEAFTTEDFGFGTYQWVVEGDVYGMDKSTVLGLFTYGPVHHIGGDAENEIDIEFSKWNDTCNGCNADFTVYPAAGHRKPKNAPSFEDNFVARGGENLTTARMQWFPDHIVFTVMKGAQPIGTMADVMKSEIYWSDDAGIPQRASPVGINSWCFETTPSAGQSVVIRDFAFVAQK